MFLRRRQRKSTPEIAPAVPSDPRDEYVDTFNDIVVKLENKAKDRSYTPEQTAAYLDSIKQKLQTGGLVVMQNVVDKRDTVPPDEKVALGEMQLDLAISDYQPFDDKS